MIVVVACCGQEICIKTDSRDVAEYLQRLKFIYNFPLSCICQSSSDELDLPCVEIIDDTNIGVDDSGLPHKLIVTIDWREYNRSSSLTDIIFEYIFLCLVERNMVFLHGATVVKNRYAYLICGPSGSGKTSISQNLCSQFGYQWMSDDQTCAQFIDNRVRILPIHDLITLRKSPFTKADLPLTSQDLGFGLIENYCQPRKLFFPDITNTFDRVQISSLQTAQLLYNEATKFLNGFGTYFVDNSGTIRSDPIVMKTPKSWEYIRQVTNYLAVSCPAYKISGLVSTVSSTIDSIINEP